MNYTRLRTSPTDDLDYCFAGTIDPRLSRRLATGREIGEKYSGDPESVRVEVHPDFTGVKLPDLLGNTQSLLILSAKARDAFVAAGISLDHCNICAFVLINHKGRVHSRDYAIVSPVGTHDISHPASDFMRYASGGTYACLKWALDSTKLSDKPHVLRPVEVVGDYFVSQQVVDTVADAGLSNFTFVDPTIVVGSP